MAESLITQLSQLAKDTHEDQRRRLITDLRKLADSLEDPDATIHRLGALSLQKAMIELGYDWDLYQFLVEGPKTVEGVAQKTGAEPALASLYPLQ